VLRCGSTVLRWLLVPLIVMPVFGVQRWAVRRADAWGDHLGQSLAFAASYLPREAPPEHLTFAEPPPQHVETEADTVETTAVVERGSGKRRAAARPQGVYVSSGTVLRLAARRAVPSGVPVPATNMRPAGIRLIGVSGLGVGMRDGDVLMDVLGTPVRSVSQVVGLVIQARGRRERQISGRFFRGNLPLNVVVEQPYVSELPPPSSATP